MKYKMAKKDNIFTTSPSFLPLIRGEDRGGVFKKKVLAIVSRIPKGKVLTYKEVAKRAGSPRAYRAVGNILNKNRDSEIPCHRVIRSDGKVGGYNRGTKVKAQLLKKENYIFGNNHTTTYSGRNKL